MSVIGKDSSSQSSLTGRMTYKAHDFMKLRLDKARLRNQSVPLNL